MHHRARLPQRPVAAVELVLERDLRKRIVELRASRAPQRRQHASQQLEDSWNVGLIVGIDIDARKLDFAVAVLVWHAKTGAAAAHNAETGFAKGFVQGSP